MKKKTSFSTKGQRADIGDMVIYRILPNRYADKAGSFVFLDHLVPKIHSAVNRNGIGAHPHRGIATLSYIINGEAEHFDSAGNYAKVYSGGVQWMKAGNGIIHDETLNYDAKTTSKLIHGFQFWINLPSKIKAEMPDYLAIDGTEVPQKELPNESGWINVIAGKYEDLSSIIPNYLPQFLYHIHLEAAKQFSIEMEKDIEVAAFLPLDDVIINDSKFDAGEFVKFDREAGTIEINNTSEKAIEILLFGGEEYVEPIVAQGPFVMNTQREISDAYHDFHAGKYGEIKYTKTSTE